MKILLVIIAVLAVALFGCTTELHITDAKHPEVSITSHGTLEFRGEEIDANDLPGELKSAGYTAEDTINILIPSDLQDYRLPYYVMGILSRKGFRRPVLVKERRSYSVTGAGARAAATPGDRTIDGALKKKTNGAQVIYPTKRQQTYRRK